MSGERLRDPPPGMYVVMYIEFLMLLLPRESRSKIRHLVVAVVVGVLIRL